MMKMKKQWKCLLALGMTLTTIGGIGFAADGVQTTSYIVNADKFQLPYAGNEAAFNHKINPGYGSALALKSINKDGTMEFYAITDRGPNGDIPTYVKDGKKVSGKFFPTPNFTPSIGIIKVNPAKDRADIIKSIPLKVNGKAITGKPVPSGLTGSTNEVALDFNMNNLGTDVNGLDTEGISLDKDGNFWISDEYGPFVAKADKKAILLKNTVRAWAYLQF